MRRLWRPELHPPSLTGPGGVAFCYAQLQEKRKAPRDKFPSHWRNPDVRGVLRAACGRACAYCCDLVGRTGEDVEHFRPKNLYWFAAYSLANYVSSCRRCNSSRKVNRFPLEQNAARATSAASLAEERRLLLDPVVDDVEAVLYVELHTKRYLWAVLQTAPAQLRARAEETIRFFRLNADADLLSDRINAVQEFLLGITSSDVQSRECCRRRASRFMPHGAAIRSVLAQTQPALLPTVAEEVQWHVVDCVQILQLHAAASDPNPETAMLIKYALAAIWSAPPDGLSRETVGSWFKALDVAAATEPLTAELRGSGT